MTHDMELTQDEQRENRELLLAFLRSPMPKGFHWDYTVIEQERSCGTIGCAIGLARLIFENDYLQADELGELIGLGVADSRFCFENLHIELGCAMYEITPKRVAEAIEQCISMSEGK